MRCRLARLALAACLAAVSVASESSAAQPARRPAAAPAPTASAGQPPHAWLFGTWTGGIFPAPTVLSAETCLSQPVVIFTRDLVLRATIMDQFYIQRLIETALTMSSGTQFRFAAVPPAAGALLAGRGVAAAAGFGCDSEDALVVERQTENQIAFPGCGDFPYPLVRCPSR